jgi:putative inorganic carbon (HCO3(-)) transporter
MNFGLFLLLNAVLLIRPEELFPAIAGLRLYLIVIVPCLLTSLPRLVELLSPSSLRDRPVAVCVLLFFAATLVSLCVQGRVNEAFTEFGPEFGKVILYYFLLLAVVDTPERYRAFAAALILLIGVLTGIALAQQYGLTQFDNITPCLQVAMDPETGESYTFPRLVSTGIFNDPNDLCLVLGLGIWCCIYCGSTNSFGLVGWAFWLLPVPLYVFALLETHSRGGLMGVLAGGAAYLYSRFGGPKAFPLAIAGIAVALAAIGGRQGNIGGGGTAHERLMMWADGLGNLFAQKTHLLTGLGVGFMVEEHGLVAHNSFVQAYVEQGILGGGSFLAAFILGLWLTDRLGRGVPAPDWAVQARPFAFAAVAGYAMGCYSLTRNFVVPTYLTLGLASVLLDAAAPTLPEKYQVSGRWFGWLFLFGIVGLVFIKLATQVLGMAGV